MDKNTQHPVAWIEACDLDDAATSGSATVVIHAAHPDYECVPLYTAHHVPRDVLMAALVEYHGKVSKFLKGEGGPADVNEVADRYASKVQPEPVNQQMLAALKEATEQLDAMNASAAHAVSWIEPRSDTTTQRIRQYRAAIAAAEAAQPAGEHPRCACGDSFTVDAVCANCLAAQQPASAQPVVVPDELNLLDCSNEDFCNGWNACRNAMLYAALKPEGV